MSARRWRKARIVAVLILLVLLVVAALTHRFGERVLRGLLLEQAAALLVPGLRIDAPLEWSLYPEASLTVRDVSVVDDDGVARLRVRELRVILDRDVLFERRLHARSVTLAGLELTLSRDQPNHWRADGWVRTGDQGAGASVVPGIDLVHISDAMLRVDGEPALVLSSLDLSAGPILPAEPGRFKLTADAMLSGATALNMRIALGGGFAPLGVERRLDDLSLVVEGEGAGFDAVRIDLDIGRVMIPDDAPPALVGILARVSMQMAGVGLDGRLASAGLRPGMRGWTAAEPRFDAELRLDDRRMNGTLAASGLIIEDLNRIDLQGFELDITHVPDPPLMLELSGGLDIRRDAASGIVTASLVARDGTLALPHPAGGPSTFEIAFEGDAGVTLDPADIVSTAQMHGRVGGTFDATRFDGQWQFESTRSPSLAVQLVLDRLDLDAYLPPPAAASGPLDLSIWRDWPVTGQLTVQTLRVRGLQSRDATLSLGR
ncbi:AsmA family protein [Rhodocyclaceae bacterium SMB388]